MKFGSICSGIEAASLAWTPLGWEAKFFGEVEPFPSAVLMQRWGATKPKRPLLPNETDVKKEKATRESWLRAINNLPEGGSIPNLGDFTKIEKDDYEGNIDLLVGGCPCQAFSIAGLRQGLDDPRGNLSLEFVRLAYKTGCRWVVFENVPGILSSGDGGSDFAQFLSLLVGWEVPIPPSGWRTAGVVKGAPGCFGVAWRVLDAQYTRVSRFPYAVPQRRRRLILVGYLGDWQHPAKVLFDGEMCQRNPPTRKKTKPTIASDSPCSTDGTCVVRMREGKPGGGKGPLVGNGMSHTLATGNDQICFDVRRTRCARVECAETLVATDYKGGKAVSFFPYMQNPMGEEECCVTLINGGAPGHQNAIAFFEGHNGRNFKEVPPNDSATQTVIARYGTGGNSMPLVLHGDEGAYAFVKNDAGGLAITPQREISPTIRSEARLAVAVPSEPIALDGDKMAKAERAGGSGLGVSEKGVMYTQTVKDVHAVAYEAPKSHAIVRRLLPLECERLQGMPDNYTRISWKGKGEEECPDAPRYKAIGNSMAINVMAWVGERIQAVEDEINGK